MTDLLRDNEAIKAALDNLRDTIAREAAADRSTIKTWKLFAISQEGDADAIGAGCQCQWCKLGILLCAARVASPAVYAVTQRAVRSVMDQDDARMVH